MILAKKIIGAKVVEKRFSERCWDLLGANKQGWVKIDPVEYTKVSEMDITAFLSEKKNTLVEDAIHVREDEPITEDIVHEKRTYKKRK